MKRYRLLSREEILHKCGKYLLGLYSITLESLPRDEQFFKVNSLDELRDGSSHNNKDDIRVNKLINLGIDMCDRYGYIPHSFIEDADLDYKNLKVKIKTFESMKAEFGVSEFTGSIQCEHSFNLEMENGLPRNRIITLNGVNNDEWKFNGRVFYISKDMIESYIKEEEKEYVEISEPRKKSNMKYVAGFGIGALVIGAIIYKIKNV